VSAYIPVIDLRAPRHEVAATIDAAARESGFLVVTGHGVDPELIQRMHDVTLELFRQPAAWKQRWRPPADVAGLRGMHLVPSRVSAAEDIATCERVGQRVALDGEGLGLAFGGKRVGECRRHAEVEERRHRGRAFGLHAAKGREVGEGRGFAHRFAV
jgi:hypothetical protein